MAELWQFFTRYAYVFLFLFLELIGFQFLFTRNAYQRAKFLNQHGQVQAYFSSIQTNVEGYFQLQAENDALAEENAKLLAQSTQILNDSLRMDSTFFDSIYTYQIAEVISSPLYSANSYLTINKGEKHGVKKQDGVLSAEGIVGKVVHTSDNYSLVMPVIHPNFRISVLHNQSQYNGNLSWNGANYDIVQVADITRNAEVKVDEELVSSQYAKSFPTGSKIGTIQSIDYDVTGNFYQLNVDLYTNFRKLRKVYICQRKDLNEIIELENQIP